MATLIFPVILAPQFGFTILRVPASVISLFLAHKRETDVHLIVSDACAEGRPGVGAQRFHGNWDWTVVGEFCHLVQGCEKKITLGKNSIDDDIKQISY